MKIKYIPVYYNPYADPEHKNNPNTTFEYVDENTLKIDGEDYHFPPEYVDFPDIGQQTDFVILEARRDDAGELYITARRYYYTDPENGIIAQQGWDTGDYHDFNR